jgi:hypothetical protein
MRKLDGEGDEHDEADRRTRGILSHHDHQAHEDHADHRDHPTEPVKVHKGDHQMSRFTRTMIKAAMIKRRLGRCDGTFLITTWPAPITAQLIIPR